MLRTVKTVGVTAVMEKGLSGLPLPRVTGSPIAAHSMLAIVLLVFLGIHIWGHLVAKVAFDDMTIEERSQVGAQVCAALSFATPFVARLHHVVEKTFTESTALIFEFLNFPFPFSFFFHSFILVSGLFSLGACPDSKRG